MYLNVVAGNAPYWYTCTGSLTPQYSFYQTTSTVLLHQKHQSTTTTAIMLLRLESEEFEFPETSLPVTKFLSISLPQPDSDDTKALPGELARDLAEMWDLQSVWADANKWLLKEQGERVVEDTYAAFEEVRTILGRLGWGDRLRIPRCVGKTKELALFLSDKWLGDEHIDMLMGDIIRRLELTVQISAKVTDLSFQRNIEAAYNHQLDKSTGKNSKQRSGRKFKCLEDCIEAVSDGGCKQIYFPAHVNGNHWVPFLIDFKARTLHEGANQLASRLTQLS